LFACGLYIFDDISSIDRSLSKIDQSVFYLSLIEQS
jgi:hypothetical protein